MDARQVDMEDDRRAMGGLPRGQGDENRTSGREVPTYKRAGHQNEEEEMHMCIRHSLAWDVILFTNGLVLLFSSAMGHLYSKLI
jgi:hypothetical protein